MRKQRKDSYPRSKDKQLKETINKLRGELNRLERENRRLTEELNNVMKPIRPRKQNVERPEMTQEEWRLDFVKRFKERNK